MEAIEKKILETNFVPIEDGVVFRIKQVTEIMDEAEYPGVLLEMNKGDAIRNSAILVKKTGNYDGKFGRMQ